MIENKKTYILIITILVSILIISSVVSYFNEGYLIKIIKDISLTLTLTLSITININSYTYITNVHNENNINKEYINQLDNEVFKSIKKVFENLDNYFINRDVSQIHKGDYLLDFMSFIDIDTKQIGFKFSDKKLNSKLNDLVKNSKEFINLVNLYMVDYGDEFLVTHRKKLINTGATPSEFNKYENEEKLLTTSLENVLKTYKELSENYYKNNTPH